MQQMMALGQFVFSLPTLAYNEFRRSSAWRHPSNSRVGARPARQSLGPGDDTITLTGVLAPEFKGDPRAIEQLRAMAEEGRLTSEVVINALKSQAKAVKDEFETLPATIGRSVPSPEFRRTMGLSTTRFSR